MKQKIIEKIIICAAGGFTALMMWDVVAVNLLTAPSITIQSAFGFIIIYEILKAILGHLIDKDG